MNSMCVCVCVCVCVNICPFSTGHHRATFPGRFINRVFDEPTSATARQHEGRYVMEQDSF